jgi:hypothetical protein
MKNPQGREAKKPKKTKDKAKPQAFGSTSRSSFQVPTQEPDSNSNKS